MLDGKFFHTYEMYKNLIYMYILIKVLIQVVRHAFNMQVLLTFNHKGNTGQIS